MANSVYWVGADNNVYLKGPSGVQNLGSANNANYNLGSGGFESNTLHQSIQATRISDPNPPASSGAGSSSSSSGASSTGTIDPSVAALLGGEIGNVNTQIGGLGGQLSTDLANNTNQYNSQLNSENQAWQNAQDANTTQSNRTVQNELTAKGTIANNVRNSTRALQTLLGLAGSGSSSASEEAAPFAASQAGDQQQQGVQQTYGENLQDLATALNTSKQQHNSNLDSLSTQKFQADQKANSDINSTKQSLLSTLAQLTSQQADAKGLSVGQAQAMTAPFLAQINQLLGQQGQYNSAYPSSIAVAAPTSYAPPSLGSYNFGSIGAPGATQSTASTAQNAPLLTTAAQKDKNTIGS